MERALILAPEATGGTLRNAPTRTQAVAVRSTRSATANDAVTRSGRMPLSYHLENAVDFVSPRMRDKLFVFNAKRFIGKAENVEGMIAAYIRLHEPKGHVAFDPLLPHAGPRWYGPGNRGRNHELLCADAGWGGIFPKSYDVHLRSDEFDINILNSGVPGAGKSCSNEAFLHSEPELRPTLLETNMGLRDEAKGVNEYDKLMSQALGTSGNPLRAYVTLRNVKDTIPAILQRGNTEGPDMGRTVGVKVNAEHSINSIKNTIEAFERHGKSEAAANGRLRFGINRNLGTMDEMHRELMSSEEAVAEYKAHLVRQGLWDGRTLDPQGLPDLSHERFEEIYRELTQAEIARAEAASTPYPDDLIKRTLES